MGKKLTFEYVRQYFEDSGCELIEKEYNGNCIPMEYRCVCGNISKISFNNFQCGERCRSCGCKKIGDRTRLSFEYVKQYFKDNNCELLENGYKNSDTKMKYKCKCGNISKVNFGNFRRGNRCKECGCVKRSTREEFIRRAKEIHNNRYNYSKVEYKNSKTKVIIICPEHGEFKQKPGSHLLLSGCPFCIKKSENRVKELLLEYFKDWIIIFNKKIWDKYKDYNHRRFCDFWMEKDNLKVIVEYDGKQHYMPVCFNGMSLKKAEKEFENTQIKDKLDAEFCKENNIILHRIKYDEDKEQSIERLKIKL